MSNIVDYIKWRGDLTFKKSAVNEVDGMIFAKLSYLAFDVLLTESSKTETTLKEYAQFIKTKGIDPVSMLFVKTQDYVDLLEECENSARFKNIKVSDFYSIFDPKKEIQFAAVTFELDNKMMVIAYRGTDDTVAGWKEDFNMGFLETVPSQAEAVKYLNIVAEKYPDRKLVLAGHSKGGNLALYSAIMSPLKVNTRIERVYNYDGPGFLSNIEELPTYKRLIDRITTLVPESSIIGMLLERKEKSIPVKSTATGGFNQHSGFTWELIGTKFVHLKQNDKGSQMIDTALKTYLRNSTVEQRKTFADALSVILKGYEGYTLTELTADKIKIINKLTKGIEGLDKETKNILINSVRLVFTEGIKGVRQSGQLQLPAVPSGEKSVRSIKVKVKNIAAKKKA